MDRFSSHKSVSSTTKMVRVVLSGGQKRSSPWEKLFSFLWIIGALLIIVVYLVIPMLIALRHIPNMLVELFFAAGILFIAELIVSAILLKIARPTRTPSVPLRPYQPGERSFATPPSAQTNMPDIDQSSTLRLPVTPLPMPVSTSPGLKKRSFRPSGHLSLPVTDRATAESPEDLLANLQTVKLLSHFIVNEKWKGSEKACW
jgi:hypothetical protein